MADVEKLNINSTDYDIADAQARADILNKQDIMQVDTMPTASADNLGKIIQWIGGGNTYTDGYFYQCVSDGEPTPTYSWAQIDVQPAGSSETIQVSSLPTAGADELGNIYEYIGTTSGDLVHGDFYECVHDVVSESSLSVLTTGGPVILRFSVDKSTFESYVQPTGDTILNFQYNNNSPAFTWKILPDNTQVTLSDYGISITEGTPTSTAPQSEFRAIYTAVKDVYKWVKKNVTKDSLEILQNKADPALNSFIDSRINSASDVSETAESVIIGKNTRANGSQSVFIGNNITQSNPYGRCVAIGNNVSGGSTYNVTIGTGAIGSERSVVIGDGAIASSGNSVVIGSYRDNQTDVYKTGSTSVTIGDTAKPYKSTNSVVLGAGATITQANTARDVVIGQGATLAGSDSIAIGHEAIVNNSSAVAVGAKTQASQTTSIALGASAKATASGAIQIGAGTNSMPNTLKIGSYQLMNNSGVVPYERLSSDTPANGEVLQYSSISGAAVWTDPLPTATASVKGGVKVGNGLEISNAVLSTKIKVFDVYQNPDDYEAGTTAYFKSTGNGYLTPNCFYVATGRFVVNVAITSATCTYDDVTIDNDAFYNAISYAYENQVVPCYSGLTLVIESTNIDWFIAVNGEELHTQDLREWGLTFTNMQATTGDKITIRMSYGGGTLSKNLWKKLLFVDVIDDLTSSNKYDALSANQGRMLKQMIDSKEDIGRFLALWDSNTGTARYLNTGFEYERGDYFIISNISVISLTPVYTSHGGSVHHIEVTNTEEWVTAFGDDNQTIHFVYSSATGYWAYNGQNYDMQDLGITYQGAAITNDTMDITYTNGKNYKPDGATYTGASTTLATDDVQVSDMWFYDGEHWVYLENHERSIAIDDEMSATSENPVQNKVITTTLNDYQLKLTAGNNITINQNNVISAVGGSGVGVPEITDVFPIMMKDDSALPDEDFKSRYSPIYFSTNLTIEQLVENMNKQYVTVARYTKNNRGTKGRARGKMSVMNDQRVKMDRRMYCYRYEDDNSYSENNPQRYYYFYAEAATESQGRSEDLSLYTSLGYNDVATLATNVNCLKDCGETFTSFGEGNLERYEAGDIDTYINVNDNNAIDYHDYITGSYQCYEYEKDDKKYYIWEYEDSSIDNNHYVYDDGGYVPEYIPDYFNQLTAVGPASFQGFIQGARRKDLDVKRFNSVDHSLIDFCNALYDTTTVGSTGDTHVRWNCYWFDFPIMPKLLAECKVFLPKKTGMSFSGKFYKLRDLRKIFDDNNLNYQDYFKQNGLVRLELPYDTYYLYMRICAWQKMCFSRDEWTSRFDFPYAMREGVFGERGFGSPRGGTWRWNGPVTAINTYLEFNLAESDSVSSGKPSRSKPVKKRLTATTEKGKQTIRD